MRLQYSSNKFNPSVIILSLAIFSLCSHQTTAQDGYWIPADPPEALYVIDAEINLEGAFVEGEEAISFKNTTSKPITILALDWSINDMHSIEVFTGEQSLSLINVPFRSRVTSPLFYELPKPIQPGSAIELKVKFRMNRVPTSGNAHIVLNNWFPRLWWGDLPTSDKYKAGFNVPEGYAPAVSGRLNEETGYYENDGVSRFGIFMGNGMKSESREVDDVLITALYVDAGYECARLCLDTAVDVVRFYKDWLGFYPYKFLYIVPGGAGPWGGYPYASGIVVIHGQEVFESAPLLHWQWITAHEIGHQYWGEYVMDPDTPDWLWIGLGIYADREYVLARNLGLDKHVGLMNRYLLGVKNKYDTTMDIPPTQYGRIRFDFNNVVVHGKGFSVISALESVLGKGTFQRIYKRCLSDYGRKRLGFREFWRVCEEESGEDLDWFFESWVRSNKYLCYEITSKECIRQGDGFLSTIHLKSSGTMTMPVPVKAVFADGTSQVKHTNIALRTSGLTFESSSELVEVVLNPENRFAMLETPLDETLDEIVRRIRELPYVGAGEDAFVLFEKALELNLDNANLWFKLGMALYDGEYYQESFVAFEKVLALNPTQNYHFASEVWMGHLKDLSGEREEALKHYDEALKHSEGAGMMHSQYNMILNRQWVEERLKTPFSRRK